MNDCLKIFTDGGARGNPGPAASAFLIYKENGDLLHQDKHFLGTATNNIAEYSAVLAALEYLVGQNYQVSCIKFFLDSELVVRQLSGIYKIKNETLSTLAGKIRGLLSPYQFSFHHIPREQNKDADKLVNICLDENVNQEK